MSWDRGVEPSTARTKARAERGRRPTRRGAYSSAQRFSSTFKVRGAARRFIAQRPLHRRVSPLSGIGRRFHLSLSLSVSATMLRKIKPLSRMRVTVFSLFPPSRRLVSATFSGKMMPLSSIFVRCVCFPLLASKVSAVRLVNINPSSPSFVFEKRCPVFGSMATAIRSTKINPSVSIFTSATTSPVRLFRTIATLSVNMIPRCSILVSRANGN